MPKLQPTMQQMKVQMEELKDQTDELDGVALEVQEDTVKLSWGPYTKTMTQAEFNQITNQ